VKEGVALRSDVGSAEEEKKQSYGLPNCGVFCVFAESLPSIPDNYRRAAKRMKRCWLCLPYGAVTRISEGRGKLRSIGAMPH
jgi:hypothetical protein